MAGLVDYDGLLDDLLDVGGFDDDEEGLSEWELKFVDDIDKRRQADSDRPRCLTPKQAAKLQEIWEKHCG